MDQLSASLSFDEQHLALGGSIELDAEESPLAALALVDLSDDHILFAKRFGMAQAITAVAVKPAQNDSKVVALAMNTEPQQAFLLVVDTDGSLASEPMLLPESALSGYGNPDLNRATILFDAAYNTVLALGHDDSRDFMTVLSNFEGKVDNLNREDYIDFQLTQGNDSGCAMTLADQVTSKVFLAGRQATSGGAVAALSLVDGEIKQTQELQITGASEVDHIFIDQSDARPQLFGTAVTSSNQAGVWRLNLSIDGQAEKSSLA